MSEQREEVSEGTRTAEALLIGAMAGAVILALLFGAYLIGFSQGEKQAEPERAGETTAPAETAPEDDGGGTATAAGPGSELFAASCGSCHVLEAADTTGTTGPDLDTLAPSEEQVLSAIENGGAGSGQMPAGLLAGEEAQQVAAFVAESAGGP
jgi:mono/diheme cytochrome c family protein